MERMVLKITGNDCKFNFVVKYTDGEDSMNQFTIREYNSLPVFNSGDEGVDGYDLVDLTSLEKYSIDSKCIRFYHPIYNPSIYDEDVMYVIEVFTSCPGKSICLGQLVVNPNDMLATSPIRYCGVDFQEYVDVIIPNPELLMTGEDYVSLREDLNLGDWYGDLRVHLKVVSKSGDDIIDHINYDNSSCGMQLRRNPWRLSVSMLDEIVDVAKFSCIHNVFDNSGKETIIKYYLSDNYGVTSSNMTWEVVIKDLNNIYKYLTYTTTTDDTLEIPVYEFEYNSWDEWEDGMFLQVSCTVNSEYEDIMIMSNELPVSKEMFKFMVSQKLGDVNVINLDNVNMNDYSIDVVNKIEQIVVSNDAISSDSKSNIIKPVFFRVSELGDLTLHTEINENISINLDSYKSKVDQFKLQIGKYLFTEIGRNGTGVIFQIISSNLPSEEGNYYILDGSTNDLITSGKYTYI